MIEQPHTGRTRRRWWPTFVASGVVIGVSLITAPWAFSSFARDHGEHMAEFVDFVIERALHRVDATQAQRDEVLTIAHEAREELFALREGTHQRRSAFIDQLVEDPDNAQRLEALREEQLAEMETVSRVLVASLARISAVLTPEQRLELAETHREHSARWRH